MRFWSVAAEPKPAWAYCGAGDSGGIDGELLFEFPNDELPNEELPNDEFPNEELPTGLLVLLAGCPIIPVFPPLICFMSESGS